MPEEVREAGRRRTFKSWGSLTDLFCCQRTNKPRKTLADLGMKSEREAVNAIVNYSNTVKTKDKEIAMMKKEREKLKKDMGNMEIELADYKKEWNEAQGDLHEMEMTVEIVGETFPVESFSEDEKNRLVQSVRKLAKVVKLLDIKALKQWHNSVKDRKSKILFQLLKVIGKKPHDLARYSNILCKLVVKVIGDVRTEEERKLRAKYWGTCGTGWLLPGGCLTLVRYWHCSRAFEVGGCGRRGKGALFVDGG